ncbi:Nucleosomal histone H3-Lys79 methylase, partial [Linderina pennispora]
MDLFFGNSSKAAAPPTVSIRIEERIVSKSGRTERRRPLSTTNVPASVGRSSTTTASTARRPSHPHTVRQTSSERVSPVRHAQSPLSGGGIKRRRTSHATDPTSRRSPRDSAATVSRGRERIGSLPGSPTPKRRGFDDSPPQRAAKRRLQVKSSSGSPPAGGIERSCSVPASLDNLKVAEASAPASPVAGNATEAVSSVDAVRLSETVYGEYFSWAASRKTHPVQVALHLPAPGATEEFSLLMPKGYDRDAEAKDEYLPVNDLMLTVSLIASYLVDSESFEQRVCGDKENGIARRLERARNRKNGEDFVEAVADFNALLDAEQTKGNVRMRFGAGEIPADMAIHVVEQTYNRV